MLRYKVGDVVLLKGKVVEAVFHGAPVVTTPIGAEGLPEPDMLLTVAETAAEFAEAVVSLYDDQPRIEGIAARSKMYIRRYFSTQAALDMLQLDIDPVRHD